MQIFIAWFLTIIPLTLSPGPANTMFAATGARFGLKKTLPLWLGINSICLITTLLEGFGIGEFILQYPMVQLILKYCAAAFMVYLAIKFFRSGKPEQGEVKAPVFMDGVVLQLFNFKFLFIPMIMFAQFLKPDETIWPQVLLLSFGLNAVNMAGHIIWISAGDLITQKFTSERANQIQAYFFGSLLILVSIWMLF